MSEATYDFIVLGGGPGGYAATIRASQLGATVNEPASSIRVHPTFSESVVDAARDAKDWALYLPRRK